jgi:spore germination cell wall hydrolase CwlJ-like protein
MIDNGNMLRTNRYKIRSSRFGSPLSRLWNDLRFRWHTKDKGGWIVASLIGLGTTAIGFLLYSLSSHASERRELTCLAMNVYYEARGESLAGQRAVAEVTMNRVASRRYPGTICAVVYQKNWDPLRKRYVGAFSWTEFNVVPHPEGEHWNQAWQVAKDVYEGRHLPTLDGAVHYHATYIKPSWARGRKPVARIGAHVFYK